MKQTTGAEAEIHRKFGYIIIDEISLVIYDSVFKLPL